MDYNNMNGVNNGWQNNQQYNQNMMNLNKGNNKGNMPMTFGEWIGTLLLLQVPILNMVLIFMWAFGDCGSKSKENFARACLALIPIVIVAITIYLIIYGAWLVTLLQSM